MQLLSSAVCVAYAVMLICAKITHPQTSEVLCLRPNGICKASAVPLLVRRFGLKPEERVENWWTGIDAAARFRACESGRTFLFDFTKPSFAEVAKESVPTFVSRIITESDSELCEHYFDV